VNVAIYAGIPIFVKSLQPGALRHDSDFMAKTITDVIEKTPSLFSAIDSGLGDAADNLDDVIEQHKFHSVVTDQPSVMTSAWSKVEQNKPWVHCYGCGAHVLNLLAGDFRKIPEISDILDKNRKISTLFRTHTMCKEVLKEVTAAKFGKSLNVVLGCSTRWSTDFYMVTRNIRLKSALITACVDHRITKEMRNNQDVKNLILFDCETDDTFWKATERVYHLLRPVKTGIQFCEGDSVPLSVMPRI